MNFYGFVRNVLKIVVKICFRVEIVGKENIPDESGYIFCANHLCMADPFFMICNTENEFYFIAKEELMRIPVLNSILKRMNVIPIKRGSGDLGAMRKGIEVLKEKKSLIIFPEGTRSKTGEMGEVKNGISLLIKKSDCGVVPCALVGKPHFFKKTKFVFGKPIPAGFFKEEKDLKVITSHIENEIKTLIRDNK